MRPVRHVIPAQAGGQALRAQVLYSPWGEPAWVASTVVALPAGRRQGEADPLRPAKDSLALWLAQLLLERRLTDLALDADAWGKPRLWLGGDPGPALSFSWSAGRLWAAAGRSEGGLGLDVAAPEEFAGSYPYRRVFGEGEWQEAVALTAGDRAEAAALLWSVKEAAVKAFGCGFHFFSPNRITVQYNGETKHGYLWQGSLPQPIPKGSGGRSAWRAVSARLKAVWLTVAWC